MTPDLWMERDHDPACVAGVHPRILSGDAVDADLEPALLLEHEGTLLGRWLVR